MLALHESGEQETPGSSTVLLSIIDPSGCLQVCNLGDCGLMVVRGEKIILRTEPQHQSWNLPHQLSINPFSGQIDDMSDKAENLECSLQQGDIVIMGSDGLFDNIYDKDIVSETRTGGARDIARGLLNRAWGNCKSNLVATPFADSWNRNCPDRRYFGGKVDDVTIIVCIIP
jgi:protein phosphatase PTC7